MRLWREENRERLRIRNRISNKAYRERHRDEIRERHRKWCLENAERNRNHKRKYIEENRERLNAKSARYWREHRVEKMLHCRKRRAMKKLATPKWADLEKIKEIYRQALIFGMSVDHIIPIQSKVVCGLHWEGNLRLIDKRENSRKGNKLGF